jgi:hypothetical protein
MKQVLIAAAIALASLAASAADLAITAADAFAKVRQADSRVLFVDVRDPVEIMFVGFTDAVHVNIPYLIVDRNAWNAEKGVFKTYQNPDFAARIKAELDKRGLGCRYRNHHHVPLGQRAGRAERKLPAHQRLSECALRRTWLPGRGDQGRSAGRIPPAERLAELRPAVEHEDESGQDVPLRPEVMSMQ